MFGTPMSTELVIYSAVVPSIQVRLSLDVELVLTCSFILNGSSTIFHLDVDVRDNPGTQKCYSPLPSYTIEPDGCDTIGSFNGDEVTPFVSTDLGY